jgi:hypothetical protein
MNRVLSRWAIGLVASFGVAAGCAEPEPIDRVQPDLIHKSSFEGEWYFLDTMVRAPYASHYTFTGDQGTLLRGVWEIEESTLFFYRTYEFIEGLQSQGVRADTDTPLKDADGNLVAYEKVMDDGQVRKVTRYVYRDSPVASYPIIGHFDIRQQYNALTGEPSNVKVEDSSEKYWWQREYMRIDFAKDAAAITRMTNHQWYKHAEFHGQEAHPDYGLRIQDKQGNTCDSASGKCQAQYMDFVIRAFAQAPQSYFGGFGWVPTCLFFPWYMGSFYECGEEEFHIRVAFMKVDPNNTYQPWNYDEHSLNKFGFYRSDRANWDEKFGTTFSDVNRYIRRFRMWEDFVTDAGGNLDYAKMTPKPVVYYLSEGFPRELVPGATDLADQWNGVFKEVVEARKAEPYPGRMFVLCENNLTEVEALMVADPNVLLAETDPKICQNMDAAKPYGDLRYNLLVSVNDPTQFGLYGYGPMHADPITGEIIHANAFNYTANMRIGARRATEYIEYAAGVQNFVDVTDAGYIGNAMKAKRLKGTQQGPRAPKSVEAAQIQASTVVTEAGAQEFAALGIEESEINDARVGMAKILATNEFDWLWLNRDMAAVAGLAVPPGMEDEVADPDGLLRNIVHPARLADEEMIFWKDRQEQVLGQDAICMGPHFDDSFRGLAYQYKPLYDKAVCDGLKGRQDLVFDFGVFDELGARCERCEETQKFGWTCDVHAGTCTDANGAEHACTRLTDSSICGQDEACTSVAWGEDHADGVTTEQGGKFCRTECSAKVLLQQLRNEIRRVNQVSEFTYWDPNALYTDTKDDRVTQSQIAARDIIEGIREQVFEETFDRIWSTVAMHEVGHNVGLRHNFASSTDALNYFPEYWNLKGTEDAQGIWRPDTVWSRETEAQVQGRIREQQQTSIMEYTGAFNARYSGLGRYDRAAILYGYGQLLEVFDNPPDAKAWEKYLEEPGDTDPDNFGITGQREHPMAFALRKLHYTNYPALFGTVANIQARHVVPAEEIADYTKPCGLHDDAYDSSVCGNANSFCRPFPRRAAIADVGKVPTTDTWVASSQKCDATDAQACGAAPSNCYKFHDVGGVLYNPFGKVAYDKAAADDAYRCRETCREATSGRGDVCGGGSSVCGAFADGVHCTKPDGGFYCTKQNQVEVPYRFCSDEYNRTSPSCQTHDEGTDVFDMVTATVDDYENYWPFRAYKRDSETFGPSTGYWNSAIAFMGFLRKHFEHWAYDYQRYNKDGWWENRFGMPWHLDVNGGLSQTLAAQTIFDTYANVMGRPSDGYYGWNLEKARYEPVVSNGKNQYCNIFEVREDTGARPMYPSYDFSGYLYTPYRAGTFYDRLAALMMMTYPNLLYAVAYDDTVDTRRFRLNVGTVWPQRTQAILSGLLTGEPSVFGWCVEHDGDPPEVAGCTGGDPTRVKPRLWFGTDPELDAYYSNCTPLTPEPEYRFPTTQYRLPAVAAIYGMGWMNRTYDRSFMDRARLWLKGAGNDLVVPDHFDRVEYTDPFSGKTYVAMYDPAEFDPATAIKPRDVVPRAGVEGHGGAYWPTARLVQTANDLVAPYLKPGGPSLTELSGSYAYSELQQLVGRLEILRGLYQYFEYGY